MFPVQWDRDERPIQNLPPLKPEEFKLENWLDENLGFEEYWEKFEKRFDSREDRILKPNPLIWEFLIIQTLWDYWKSGVGYIEFSLGRNKLLNKDILPHLRLSSFQEFQSQSQSTNGQLPEGISLISRIRLNPTL